MGGTKLIHLKKEIDYYNLYLRSLGEAKQGTEKIKAMKQIIDQRSSQFFFLRVTSKKEIFLLTANVTCTSLRSESCAEMKKLHNHSEIRF